MNERHPARAPGRFGASDAGIRRAHAMTRAMRLARTALLPLAICAFVIAGTSCRNTIDLPGALVGTWTTTHATYADRSFTLTPSSIEFDLGENGKVSHVIDEVYHEATPDGGDLYTIVYLGDGGLPFRYHLMHESDPKNTLIPKS